MTTSPRDWCDPPNAFGQLRDPSRGKRSEVVRRHWLPPTTGAAASEHVGAAVVQNVFCLWIRQVKNAQPHPDQRYATQGATFPLTALVEADPRGMSMKSWRGKLTGERAMTFSDIAVLVDVLPGAMPSEVEIREFLDVAWKRASPPLNWQWPDT